MSWIHERQGHWLISYVDDTEKPQTKSAVDLREIVMVEDSWVNEPGDGVINS